MDADDAMTDHKLRISPEAFVIALAISLPVAIVFAALRTVIRWQNHRTFYLDDYFLFYAVLVSALCAGVAYSIRDQMYLQIYVGLKWQDIEPDFYDEMLIFEQRIMACSALIWSAIYAIKFSFLALFRKIMQGVHKFDIYWWFITVTTVVCGAISIPLSFIICDHFGSDYMTHCPIDRQLANERIYMHTTTALDILTDVLLISYPIIRLWNMHISWQRKTTLIAMLCLSAFCIFVAAIRTSLADLPVNGMIDTSWLVFWQGIEAAVAVVIVSCTALHRVFGQHGAFTSWRATRKSKTAGTVDIEKAGCIIPSTGHCRIPSSDTKTIAVHKEWYMSNRISCTSDISDLRPVLESIPALDSVEEYMAEKDDFDQAGIDIFDKHFESV